MVGGKIARACPEKTKREDKPDRVTVDPQLQIRSHPSSDEKAAPKYGGADDPHQEYTGDLIHVSVQRLQNVILVVCQPLHIRAQQPVDLSAKFYLSPLQRQFFVSEIRFDFVENLIR